MERKRTLKDIVSDLSLAIFFDGDYEVFVHELEHLAFPDVHQVHIPGLDQTEWNG